MMKPTAVTLSTASVPLRVREDAAWVMGQAQHVQIVTQGLTNYASRLVAENPVVTSLDSDNHFVSPAEPEKTAAYVLALDSINFGSGVFAHAQKAGMVLEYAPVAQSLKKAFAQEIWRHPQNWLQLTLDDIHRTFAISPGLTPETDRLMGQFLEHLRLTAAGIAADFGSVEKMLQDYQGRGSELLEVFARWPHFNDVAAYQGRDVAIFKRAQIMLADLELALATPEKPHFGGLENLTCFADNMVPHVLRQDGLLRYSDGLKTRIDAGFMLILGSAEETELRCAAIYAVELMRDSLAGAYTSVNLDHMLWHRGYLPGFSNWRPHQCISPWY